MDPKDELLQQVLSSASREVESWPPWRQSADVRAEVQRLSEPSPSVEAQKREEEVHG